MLLKIDIILFLITYGKCVTDMNLGQMEYLADHLKNEQCQMLVYHLMRYEKLEDVPKVECIINLLHWDRTYGKGLNSDAMKTPLMKAGREDLAHKLGEMMNEERMFEFEHSPFFKNVHDEEPHTTDAAEQEFREGETVEEMVEEFEKESDKNDMSEFSSLKNIVQ